MLPDRNSLALQLLARCASVFGVERKSLLKSELLRFVKHFPCRGSAERSCVECEITLVLFCLRFHQAAVRVLGDQKFG